VKLAFFYNYFKKRSDQMDLTSPLKPDVFRVVMVILLPGLIATFPWLAWFFWPELLASGHWSSAGLVSAAFVTAIALAAGMVLEDIGAHIEVHIIDPYVCDSKGVTQDEFDRQWMDYLFSPVTDRYVAHRYLKSMVTRFKFELSMIPACVSVGIALPIAWAQGAGFDGFRTIGFLIADVSLLIFLLDQAKRGAWQLHELRNEMALADKRATA